MNALAVYDSLCHFLRNLKTFDCGIESFDTHRGCLELRLTCVTTMLAFAKHFAKEGWKPKRVNDAQRLLIGFEFDCRGDDFESFRVFVHVGDIKKFCMRYEENNKLEPQSELIDAANGAVRLPGDNEYPFTAFDDLIRAENEYVWRKHQNRIGSERG